MSDMKRNILVVGGAGYIGSHICKALTKAGFHPIVFDNLSSGHEWAVQWGPLVIGDVRRSGELDAAFSTYNPIAVMHFAANIEVGEGQQYPLRFWNNNVGGAISLFGAMKKAKVNTIVFSSTCAIYGEPQHLPLAEDHPKAPTSVYGQTKLTVEHILADLHRADGLSYAALRYFNAAGASPDAEIGEAHDPETHLIPNALKAAAGIGEGLKLFGENYDTPDGTCIRDYIHVSDLAEAHVLALRLLLEGGGRYQINIGTGSGFSVREILHAIKRVTGHPVPYELHPSRAGDVSRLYSNTTKAKKILDFTPARSTPDIIIADAWRFHAARWGLNPKDFN
jgi:UDP-glucose-4-epimerase GalE